MSKKKTEKSHKGDKLFGNESASAKFVTIYRDAGTGKFVSRRDAAVRRKSISVEKYKAHRGDGTDHTGPREK